MIYPNGLDLDLIRPELGAKYSPNLYAWLIALRRQTGPMITILHAWEDRAGEIQLAIATPSGKPVPAMVSLRGILANGSSEPTVRSTSRARSAKLITDFWPRYVRDGRCAIDPTHASAPEASGQWTHQGGERVCLWCGAKGLDLTKLIEQSKRLSIP